MSEASAGAESKHKVTSEAWAFNPAKGIWTNGPKKGQPCKSIEDAQRQIDNYKQRGD